MRLTLDSNLFRLVVSPESFPEDPETKRAHAVHKLLVSGSIRAFIAEPLVTYEALQRNRRLDFFSRYKATIRQSDWDEGREPSRDAVRVLRGPVAHPGTHPRLTPYLDAAWRLGIRILPIPRLGVVKNPEIDTARYERLPDSQPQLVLERFGLCCRAIESHGCGCRQIQDLGTSYAQSNETWFEGLAHAAGEEKQVAAAVAEWADGDAIAAHYAYSNDLFCTRDRGRSAGSSSVLHPSNRAWLAERFGIRFGGLREVLELAASVL